MTSDTLDGDALRLAKTFLGAGDDAAVKRLDGRTLLVFDAKARWRVESVACIDVSLPSNGATLFEARLDVVGGLARSTGLAVDRTGGDHELRSPCGFGYFCAAVAPEPLGVARMACRFLGPWMLDHWPTTLVFGPDSLLVVGATVRFRSSFDAIGPDGVRALGQDEWTVDTADWSVSTRILERGSGVLRL